jgi:enhancing lycopene biosynthesis protein 2
MGGQHKTCTADLIHFDEKNKIVTTPAYMLGPTMKNVAEGIRKLVDKALKLIT